MEVSEQLPKRPRLNSWAGGRAPSSSHQLIGPATNNLQQNNSHSPKSQYSSTSPMVGWGSNTSGQHARSQSLGKGVSNEGGPGAGGSSTDTGPNFSHYSAPEILDTHSPPAGDQLSHGTSSPSSDMQGFIGYQSQPPQPSDMDTSNSSPLAHTITRQQPKPLQTAPVNIYQDTTAFFHHVTPSEHPGSLGASGAELGSPSGSNTPGVATTNGYVGIQNHHLVGANNVMTTPLSAQSGIVLGGTQSLNVVTTYPPRRKAIRAAQVINTFLLDFAQ